MSGLREGYEEYEELLGTEDEHMIPMEAYLRPQGTGTDEEPEGTSVAPVITEEAA